MEWIDPMEPILRPDVITGNQWIHQVKWDGIRGLCRVENGKLRIFTRNKRDRTGFYPELDEITEKLQAKSAWLDGEIVVFDQNQNRPFIMCLPGRGWVIHPGYPFIQSRAPPGISYLIS